MGGSLPTLIGDGQLGRVIGVDLGRRRVGVAVSDAGRRVAAPRQTLLVRDEAGGIDAVLGNLVAMIDEVGATVVVVGLPLSLDGRRTEAARWAESTMQRLRDMLGDRTVVVEAFDERLTTVTANQALRLAGRQGRARRTMVDQVAAAVLLQAWLDGQARRAVRRRRRGGIGDG